MRHWVVILLVVATGTGCLNTLGVGMNALAKLILALIAMSCLSLLIAWPFLRKRTPP